MHREVACTKCEWKFFTIAEAGDITSCPKCMRSVAIPATRKFRCPLCQYEFFTALGDGERTICSKCQNPVVLRESLRVIDQVPEKPDLINHPPHYAGDTTHETIKCMEAHGLDKDFCLGSVFKYITRAGKKTPDLLLDLKKAVWYLQRKIAKLEKGEA